MNLFELNILYAMVKSKHVNFSKLIFYQFVTLINGKKRPTYVTHPRLIGLLLEFIKPGYTSEYSMKISVPLLSFKIINVAPGQDPPITQWMTRWINHPYTIDHRVYKPTRD